MHPPLSYTAPFSFRRASLTRIPRPAAPGLLPTWLVTLSLVYGRLPLAKLGPPPKPSEAGSVGRGGARERAKFSPPLGGNEAKRTLRRRGRLVLVFKPLACTPNGAPCRRA